MSEQHMTAPEALQDFAQRIARPGTLASKAVLVIEITDAMSGARRLTVVHTPGMAPWESAGMLDLASAADSAQCSTECECGCEDGDDDD